MKRVYTITGPTATGKTKLCVKLSEDFPIEIISADSRQIYRNMDIGTGKPSKEELRKVKHHLIDCIEPDERYSAYRFNRDCKQLIENIRNIGNIPLIVGGTILYIKGLVDGFFTEPEIPDDLRTRIRERVAKSPNKMHRKLSEIDTESADRIHPNDKQRIARALEVYRASGKTMTEYREEGEEYKTPLDIYCLMPERETIYKNIEYRVNKMFDKGFIEEVKKLLKMGYNEDLYSFTSIGYREIVDFLEGNKYENEEELKEDIIKQTRRYATRQVTFINNLPNVKYFNSKDKLREEISGELQKEK